MQITSDWWEVLGRLREYSPLGHGLKESEISGVLNDYGKLYLARSRNEFHQVRSVTRKLGERYQAIGQHPS